MNGLTLMHTQVALTRLSGLFKTDRERKRERERDRERAGRDGKDLEVGSEYDFFKKHVLHITLSKNK